MATGGGHALLIPHPPPQRNPAAASEPSSAPAKNLPALNFSRLRQQLDEFQKAAPHPPTTHTMPQLTLVQAPVQHGIIVAQPPLSRRVSDLGSAGDNGSGSAGSAVSSRAQRLFQYANQQGGTSATAAAAAEQLRQSQVKEQIPLSARGEKKPTAAAAAGSGSITSRGVPANWSKPWENLKAAGDLQQLQSSAMLLLQQQQQQQQQQQRSALPPPPPLASAAPAAAAPAGTSNALSPAAALKLYMNQMTLFEQGEILDFPQVYFVGSTKQKVRPNGDASTNNGYDDERGDYTVVPHDHINFRYEILSVLGKGSFGVVLKCFDWKTSQHVAIKLIRNKKRFHHQALVEVKILEHLRDRADGDAGQTMVTMTEYFYFRNHMCISFELLSINLYEFIKNNKFQGLTLSLIRRFALQMLVSLRYLKQQKVIHCDLKPENILLKQPNKSNIKIIDFGSSCFKDERIYTYIQSRFYRSPEVILGLPYDMAIDMWSFGCILAELYTGYPLFPGENEVEQLACIMEVIGVPPRHLIESSSRAKMFFDSSLQPRIVANSRGKKRRPGSRDLSTALRCTDAPFLSFLEGCLRWDSTHRLTPEQALQHEWTQAQAPLPPSAAPPSFFDAPKPPPPMNKSAAVAGGGGGGLSARGDAAQAAKGSQIPQPQQPVKGYLNMAFRDRHLFPPLDLGNKLLAQQPAAKVLTGAASALKPRPSPR